MDFKMFSVHVTMYRCKKKCHTLLSNLDSPLFGEQTYPFVVKGSMHTYSGKLSSFIN